MNQISLEIILVLKIYLFKLTIKMNNHAIFRKSSIFRCSLWIFILHVGKTVINLTLYPKFGSSSDFQRISHEEITWNHWNKKSRRKKFTKLMVVTDSLCWWLFWDVGDIFRMFGSDRDYSNHQQISSSTSVSNINVTDKQ